MCKLISSIWKSTENNIMNNYVLIIHSIKCYHCCIKFRVNVTKIKYPAYASKISFLYSLPKQTLL